MTAADIGHSSSEPSRSVEIELKFDVDDDTQLPDWSAVPGVASVGAPEPRELDARYFDTAEFALAAAGYAVRRRTGGPDAGWHIKGPRIGGVRQQAGDLGRSPIERGRVELGWPLGASADEDVPDAVRAALAGVTDAELRHIARILNSRVAYALRSADGGLIAEFVDDRVTATDVHNEAVRSWREWEVELGNAAPADPRPFFASVQTAVLAAGGRPAASASKLARALGY